MLFGYTRWIEQGDFFIWPSIRYDLKFYLGSFGALYLLVIGAGIVSNLPRLFGVPANRQMIQLMATLLYHNMPLLILSVFTAGFTEEMIFRAYLVPRLEIIFNNKYMPVLISALMFAALHFRYHSLEELLFAFLFGVVFAIHYQWYRNITILIITHAIVGFRYTANICNLSGGLFTCCRRVSVIRSCQRQSGNSSRQPKTFIARIP